MAPRSMGGGWTVLVKTSSNLFIIFPYLTLLSCRYQKCNLVFWPVCFSDRELFKCKPVKYMINNINETLNVWPFDFNFFLCCVYSDCISDVYVVYVGIKTYTK